VVFDDSYRPDATACGRSGRNFFQKALDFPAALADALSIGCGAPEWRDKSLTCPASVVNPAEVAIDVEVAHD
jgi:hypothetical protein